MFNSKKIKELLVDIQNLNDRCQRIEDKSSALDDYLGLQYSYPPNPVNIYEKLCPKCKHTPSTIVNKPPYRLANYIITCKCNCHRKDKK